MSDSPALKTIETEDLNQSLKPLAHAIRALAMDAVERANSGHPGMPMGMADVATVLFAQHMTFDASNPLWDDRDRFILSAGHGSMLQYALLYLLGYEKMTLEEIKNFRQLHALTAGHPEVVPEAGIETTTGPLGQGIATAVGFAMAEAHLNAKFGPDLVNHHTYVIASDGDLMEGISHEACSLAGHLRLKNLIVLYDDNGISIDGETSLSFSDNTLLRFQSYGWAVDSVDGHDMNQIDAAIELAKNNHQPTLIACKTHIGYGAPTKQDKASSHGAPLGAEELQGAKQAIGWEHGPFEVPDEILSAWRQLGQRGQAARQAWEKRLDASPDAGAYEQQMGGDLNEYAAEAIETVKKNAIENPEKVATRKASGNVLDLLLDHVPHMIGGSADLTGSNNTIKKGMPIYNPDNYTGRYVHYGVREHGMAAAMNGMALHGGILPYSGTFLSFADYCRPAIRLAALMRSQIIHVMTHDSIGLGEDGPTHQPVEHIASLRAMPNTYVFRPCDQTETAECWQAAIALEESPSIMALSRQGLHPMRETYTNDNLCSKGAYILAEAEGEVQVTLFASGSEVEIAAAARAALQEKGISTRLVSAPCLDLLWDQDGEYIQSLICNNSVKVAVEAAVRQGWDGLIGPHGIFVGMDGFGESAPGKDLYNHFNITSEAIVTKVLSKLEG